MNFDFKSNLALGICTLAGLAAFTQQNRAQEKEVSAQEIVIVNQDGEKVEPLQESRPVLAPVQAENGKAAVAIALSVESKDGKFIIKDADGTIREIDTTGAQSIIVNRSANSVTVNGENKTETFGKAVIIGPDGDRQEIILATPITGITDFEMPGFRGVMKVDRVDDAFVIGVHCEPVSEAMRAQLELESGLIVRHVVEKSPALTAGLQMHDILMFADDRELKSNSDLTEMVQTAGKEKNKITFTTVRAGKEVTIDVTPTERPASDAKLDPAARALFKLIPEVGGMDMKFRHLGPGVIVGGHNGFFGTDEAMKQVEEEMNAMREEMKVFRKQMREQLKAENGK